MSNELSYDSIRTAAEQHVLTHPGWAGPMTVEARERAVWFATILECMRRLPFEERRALEDWEAEGNRQTTSWPGWEEYLLPPEGLTWKDVREGF
jgi:hypothetical protein